MLESPFLEIIAGLCGLIVGSIIVFIALRLVAYRLEVPIPFPPPVGLGAGIGLALFLALQILGRGALGTGDTKLAILIGAMRGFPGVLNALSFGVIIGGVAAAILIFALRRGRKEFFAYAPYLAAGAIV